MNDYRDDDLDRLLFSLPLEEPPAGMRESILAATIYRPPAFVLKPWEMWSLAALAAVAVWLCILIVSGGAAAFAQTTGYIFQSAWQQISSQNALVWLAAGIGATIWTMLLNSNPIPVPWHGGLSRR